MQFSRCTFTLVTFTSAIQQMYSVSDSLCDYMYFGVQQALHFKILHYGKFYYYINMRFKILRATIQPEISNTASAAVHNSAADADFGDRGNYHLERH